MLPTSCCGTGLRLSVAHSCLYASPFFYILLSRLNEHWHGRALRFSRGHGLNFAQRSPEHRPAAAVMPHDQTTFIFRTCRKSSNGRKLHQPRSIGFGYGIISGISALLFIRLEEGMALDTNLDWRTGANGKCCRSRHDLWLDHSFHSRSLNESGQSGSWSFCHEN